MRNLEVGRFLRLRSAILEAVDSVEDQSRKTAGNALARAYKRFRAEVYDIVPEDHREEFERVCPRWTLPARGSVLSALIEGQSRTYSEAKLMMRSLAGFLDGYVQETRMNIEAETYAAARLKAERPVGFQPS